MSTEMSKRGSTATNPTPKAFPPSPEFAARAIMGAESYTEAAADPVAYWAGQARQLLTWEDDFSQTLDESNPPFYTWFADGTLNAAYNAVDRHVEAGLGNRVAIHWEGEPGDTRTITYAQLQDEVSRAATALVNLGVETGDRVAIYLPMLPEAVIAMLACARIGAPHSVIFGGFSADALRSRILDAQAKVVITADGGYRRGKPSALKPAVDEALAGDDMPVTAVLVVERTKNDVDWVDGRDVWWHEAIEAASPMHAPVAVPAEHPLFILYTSGTTGTPKGIFHTTGGFLTQSAYTHRAVFDLHPETDVYWCTADIGWITGHSYLTYGPLVNGATQVIYEGTPDWPDKDRWWQIVEKYGVTIMYTAPTAIRTCMKWGEHYPGQHDLSSLRVLGSVGEPINPEAWRWYRRVIGNNAAPVVDTWWQTETGAIMISPLPGVITTKPGSAQRPIPGIDVDVVDDQGTTIEDQRSGYLVVKRPWPSMARGIWGDEQRFIDTYWSRFPGMYFAGDGASKDEDGDIWLLGRVDDVMNVSGHRLSTAEIESALVSHHRVAEAAVVGANDETTGQAVVAFVILRQGGDEASGSDRASSGTGIGSSLLGKTGAGGRPNAASAASSASAPDSSESLGVAACEQDEEIIAELRAHVGREISPIAKPKMIMIVSELPKTRSGKILRRLLRDVAEHRDVGDVTTLADSSVVSVIAEELTSENGTAS